MEGNMEYDSTIDTNDHRKMVDSLMGRIFHELSERIGHHDESKLFSPEKEAFDIATPKLRGLTYGSDEYKKSIAELGPALAHHYQANRHHPEHFENGIDGMTLTDIVEMFADWLAAGMRHANGNFARSVEVNKVKSGLSDQLGNIFLNTAKSFHLI
jgi:hypothetical protein